MRIDVITIFPELFDPFRDTSLIGEARRSGQISQEVVDLSAFTSDHRGTEDDPPCGGGPGIPLSILTSLGSRLEVRQRSLWSLDCIHRIDDRRLVVKYTGPIKISLSS